MGFELEQPTSGYQLEPEPEATWGEALGSLFDPLKIATTGAKAVGEAVEGVGEMVKHPIDTATNLYKLGLSMTPAGTVVKAAGNLISPFLSDEHKTQVAEILKSIDDPKNAMGQMLKDRYGSVAAIKKTIRDDPGGFLMDVGTVFTGGEAAVAKAATLLPKASTAAKVAGGVEKGLGYAKYVDPVTGMFKGADVLARKLGPKWFGTLSGVGDETMAGIRDLAAEEGPRAGVKQNEFADALKGNVTAEQFVDRAEQGIKNMRNDANYGYAVNKKDWVAAGGKLDMSVIDQAERDMVQSLHTSGGSSLLNEAQRESFGKMQEIIEELRKRGPGAWTVEELDALKRNLNKVSVPLGDRELMRVRTGLSNAVKDNILANAQGTKYHSSMNQFAEAMDVLDELKSSFALEKNSGQHTTMSKLQSVLRNNVATQYGTRKALFDTLEKEGRVDLKPWLMGMTANSATPRGINRGVIGGILSTGNVIPGLSTVATLGSSSPRIGAEVMYGLGKHGKKLPGMSSWLRQGAADIERTRESQEAHRDDELPPPVLPPPRRAAAPPPAPPAPPMPGPAPGPGIAPGAPPGLFGRKRGGRVGYDDGGEVLLQPQATPALVRLPLAGGRVALGANFDPSSRYGVLEGGYERPFGRNVTLGIHGNVGKDLGPEGASARPNWGVGLRGRVRFARGGYADGGDVDELDIPSLSAMRGANYFTPAVIQSKRQAMPSMPVLAPTVEAKLPTMDAKAASGWGDLVKEGVKTYEDYTKKSEEKEEKRKNDAIIANLRAQAAAGVPPPPSTSAKPDPTDPGGGAVAASPATPLSGDSYEAKVGNLESGGKDDAVNASTGTAGRYQFAPATAEGIRKAHPELQISDNWRTNVDDQKKLMKHFTDENREILRKHLGREPTGGELYAAHFYGPSGAVRFLSSLDKPITVATTEAERQYNPHLYRFKTGQDWLDYHNRRFA
jgi:hypothetical protein